MDTRATSSTNRLVSLFCGGYGYIQVDRYNVNYVHDSAISITSIGQDLSTPQNVDHFTTLIYEKQRGV